MAEINFITWGALSTKIWEKSTIRCHAGSYWPFAKFLWHPSSSFSADIMQGSGHGVMTTFFFIDNLSVQMEADFFFLRGLFGMTMNRWENRVSGWVRIIVLMLWKRLFFGRWWSHLQSSQSFWNFCLTVRFRQPMNLSKKPDGLMIVAQVMSRTCGITDLPPLQSGSFVSNDSVASSAWAIRNHLKAPKGTSKLLILRSPTLHCVAWPLVFWKLPMIPKDHDHKNSSKHLSPSLVCWNQWCVVMQRKKYTAWVYMVFTLVYLFQMTC